MGETYMMGVPHVGPFSGRWLDCFAGMVKPKDGFTFTRVSGKPVDLARDVLVMRLLQAGCDWLLQVDADMWYSPRSWQRLVERTRADPSIRMIAALTFTRLRPVWPTIYRGVTGRHRLTYLYQRRVIEKEIEKLSIRGGETAGWLQRYPEALTTCPTVLDGRAAEDGMVRADATGAAFLMVHREVFEALEPPWFLMPTDEHKRGEDFYFFQRAREAGFELWVDRSVIVGHEWGNQAVGPRDFLTYHLGPIERRMIFCLSPGRSGTKYLARVMATVPGVEAAHEAEPDFADVMRRGLGDAGLLESWWREEKLPAIDGWGDPVWVETSHLFGKGFVEPLLAAGRLPDVVVLRRPAREVALSIWRRDHTPARTEKGRRYYLQPDDAGVLLPVQEGEDWRAWSDYQLCYWYALEQEVRMGHYAGLLQERGAAVVETTLKEVTTEAGFRRVLEALGLPAPGEGYEQIRGDRINANPDWLERYDQAPTTIDAQEEAAVEAAVVWE